ncbi:conserved hypothetical protein [Hyella patelloides LEGE 07179]|uniref:Uncharacterized protein n=1 Tax=Hyella patelloides LEGE 07179 TaxID=945734 RepID=A0A563VT17_9CYAN|nr:COP23 domain-containing protein [Hyella patelloides]VEP14409.1 conserved hypothetical protein [Hyella patelloides LEGE 07179]
MNRHLSVLFIIITTILLKATLVLSESENFTKVSFFCKNNESKLSTVAQNNNGSLQPIFHWHSYAFDSNTDLSKSCKNATKILNIHFSENPYLSSFLLIPTVISRLPGICISDEFRDCRRVLFVSYPDRSENNPHKKAYQILNEIIDTQFQDNWIKDERSSTSTLEIELF